MLAFERIIALYAPFNCLSCGDEHDRLLCDSCRDFLPVVPSRCYRCKATSRGYAVCQACKPRTPLRHVYIAHHYDGVVKELLHRAKYERAQSVLREIAQMTTPLLRDIDTDVVLVAVPTATSRVRQRGYDQAVVLARHIARMADVQRQTFLARLGQGHQVGSGRAARFRHLEGAFRVVRPHQVRNRHVILVDDVLTTGATLESAAAVLKKAGARQVDAIVFAQPS